MPDTPPPGAAVWERIRARYEAASESVADIARDIGLTRQALSQSAAKWGWRLRCKPLVPRDIAKAVNGKKATTAATIKRLKDILLQRVELVEAQLRDIGAEVNAAASERDMRATNTLVRTIEKVLDLERKNRQRKIKQARDFKYFDDAQRDQLADKIGRLQRTWRGEDPVADTADPGGGGTEQPVALLGETAKPASAND
jgi:hypothetical protein